METLLSNTLVVLGIILGIALGVTLIVYIVLPALIKKEVPVQEYVEITDKVLTKTDAFMGIVKEILPNNATVNIVQKIINICEIGVKNAEQLCKIQEITKDQRKDAANQYIQTVLKESGIEITPAREKIIEGAIEAAVYAIGHKETTEAEKQAALEEAQNQVAEANAKAAELQKTIDNIADSDQAVKSTT